MTPSSKCIILIKHCEQYRGVAYLPTPDDVWTLGWGCTQWKGKAVVEGQRCTPEEAEAVFLDELGKRARRLNRLLKGTPTSQHQYDALLSWFYNVGEANATKSTLLRYHLAGDHEAAQVQFHLWIYQGKKRLKGLIKRRAMEAALYATSDSASPPWLLADGSVKEPRI